MARVVCVYRERTDYAQGVEDWLESFFRATGRKIEVLNPDVDISVCETYDVVEYPTILALDDNGSVLASWRGKLLPLIDEANYYAI